MDRRRQRRSEPGVFRSSGCVAPGGLVQQGRAAQAGGGCGLDQVNQRRPGRFSVSYGERGPEAWRLSLVRAV